MNKTNEALVKYINENIFPVYNKNSIAHNIDHIKEVLDRAFKLANTFDVDYNILYTAVCYHDIGDHINRKYHETISSIWVDQDINLRQFFNEEEIKIICEAIEDHRASLEGLPRNIYGKIISSADRNVSVARYFERGLSHNLEKNPQGTDEMFLLDLYEYALKKFGVNGYSVNKHYIQDEKYDAYISEMQSLLENEKEFSDKARPILEIEKIKIKKSKSFLYNNIC